MGTRTYWVYILSSRNRALYIGVTNNILRRIIEHKEKKVPGFSRRYNVTQLAYYQPFADVREAIAREKEIKGWLRSKKIKLIEKTNPKWEDLSLVFLPVRIAK